MNHGSSQLRILVFISIALIPQLAQAQRGSSSSGSSTRNNIPSRTPATPDSATQPIFISGKVMLEGGGTLAEPVAIERICNGVTRREGYTDFKGQFSFQMGTNVMFQDASENDSRLTPNSGSRTGTSNESNSRLELSGCEFRAVLAGYQSSVAMLRSTGDTWQFDVGTIFLKRLGNAPGTTVSVTSMSAPKDAMRAYEKAQKLKQEKPAEAEKELSKAVKIYPQFAAAWTLLGDIHRQHEEFAAAREDYTHALSADPQFVNPQYGLAVIAMQEKKYDEAIPLTEQVVRMNAFAFPLAYFFNAAANYNLQKFDAAEESAKKFKTMDTQHEHPDVCLLLSHVYSHKQDYAGAAREIREFLAIQPNAPEAGALNAEAKSYEDLSVAKKD